MKTDKQLAEETVKVVLGVVALMRPNSPQDFDRAQGIAAMLVEHSIREHVEQALASSANAASGIMEGK